jgi:two-component system chemotaxis sensor kinase CheA
VVIELEDDGRGIDWDGIRRAAAARGVTLGAHDDPSELLFADGVTTATQVTQLSGRGVGLGALRAAVRAMGGTIEVQSVRGAGTRLAVHVPIA